VRLFDKTSQRLQVLLILPCRSYLKGITQTWYRIPLRSADHQVNDLIFHIYGLF